MELNVFPLEEIWSLKGELGHLGKQCQCSNGIIGLFDIKKTLQRDFNKLTIVVIVRAISVSQAQIKSFYEKSISLMQSNLSKI